VDCARDELLARPALSGHENACSAFRRAADLLDELLDRGALADEVSGGARRPPQIPRLRFGARQAESRIDRDEQRVGVQGFL
jgi:hypothetical protein